MGCTSDSSVAATPSEITNPVLVVVGPSGVGKDTVMAKVVEKHKDKFIKAVTHTTRSIRPGEKEGVNYYYVSKEDFMKLNDEGGLIENNFYNNNFYGLSKKELAEGVKGDKILYAIIDINGAKAVHNLNIPANFVAILPPSEKTLEDRLKGRGTETPEVIQGRLNTAKTELKEIAGSKFFNIEVINDDLEKAVLDLEEKLKKEYPQLNC